MPATGKARALGGARVCARPAMVTRPDIAPYTAAAAITTDYFWPTGPPAPVPVPICWASGNVALRQRPPSNRAVVTGAAAMTSRASNRPSVETYTVGAFSATLDTACTADAAMLAAWVVTYRGQPRMTVPQITFNLLIRTDSERRLLLGVRLGQRITLTGVPAEFPTGATTAIVAGIAHTVGVRVRTLTWNLSSVDGQTAGTSGPWFRVGSSFVGGPDVLLF